MAEKKILFIGAGNMAEAIISSIVTEGLVNPENILVNNRTPYKMLNISDLYGVKACHNVQEGVAAADIIVIGVKPQDMEMVLKSIAGSRGKDSIIVSVAAGKSIPYMEQFLGSARKIIRVMPNTLVTVKRGFSALCCNANVNKEEFDHVESLFKGIGDTVRIGEEIFDSFTGVSCTGPAYIYEFLEAMIDAGVYAGISRADSARFALQNMMGVCEMILASGEHPAILKERMASPGGVTITGLKVFNENGFKGLVQNAVLEGVDRAKEL